jgi:hypothetical protein
VAEASAKSEDPAAHEAAAEDKTGSELADVEEYIVRNL